MSPTAPATPRRASVSSSSTDGGKSFTKVIAGRRQTSRANRGVGAVAVDPRNPEHLLVGTAVARHGSSSVNGGRFTPPGAPKVGLYETHERRPHLDRSP